MLFIQHTALFSLLVLILGGCNNPPSTSTERKDKPAQATEANKDSDSPPAEKTTGGYDTDALAKRISESMAQLSAEDRKLAEAQKFCPVGVVFDDSGKPIQGFLGQIGKPVKHMVKDQAVFIMCPSCTEEFQNDTDKYMQVLAKIKVNQ